jgi:hypothetical protein
VRHISRTVVVRPVAITQALSRSGMHGGSARFIVSHLVVQQSGIGARARL